MTKHLANVIILTGGTWTPYRAPKIQRSLGPYRIASALEDSGYSVFVLDFIIHLTVDEIKLVLSQHIDQETLWAGFSSTFFWADPEQEIKNDLDQMYFGQVEKFQEVIKFLKEKSNCKIVYGGSKAHFNTADPLIDYYVYGYADTAIVELTNSLKDGTNLAGPYIDSKNFPEPLMSSINTHWHRPYNILQNEGLPIELARGCIFKCRFCSYPLLGKKKGTYLRDPSVIKDELVRMYEAHGTTSYYITDDTFNDDNDKIESLHKIFTSLPFKPKFSCYLRIDLIHKYPHQADLLTEMGLIGNYFGIESLNQKSAVSIGKGLHPHKVKDRLYWLREKWKNKVNMAAGFILGLPYDNYEYFSELINWCIETDNPLQNISFYPLYLFKNTNIDLNEYRSEFSLKPEIYGYEFTSEDRWKLKESDLTFESVKLIANKCQNIVNPTNKFAEFQMITALNTGISLEDLYSLTVENIYQKYDTAQMNEDKLTEYKTLINLKHRDK